VSRGIFLETLKTLNELEQARVLHSVELLRDRQNSAPELSSELYWQARDLETTFFAEGLDGENRTDFPFNTLEGKLYVVQPKGATDWLALHENGLARARAKSWEDSRFKFYADIAEAEFEEAKAQQHMVQERRPATLFSISLCGDDLASPASLKAIGRDPEKSRGYIRASVFDGQNLHLYSCSVDGMTTQDARDIYQKYFSAELPKSANSIGILRNRIKIPGEHRGLLDVIAPPKGRETHQFVLSQTDLIDAHMDGLQALANLNLGRDVLAERADNLRYDIVSSLKQRYEGTWVDAGSLAESVAHAGMIERDAGTEFYGCDNVLTAENKAVRAGYLNARGFEALLGKKKFESKFCPNCLPKPKPGKKVKAWREGDRLGCGDCGHVIDVCTKKTVRQGKHKDSKVEKTSFWA